MIEEHGDLFLTRVYTAREILYCRRRVATEHFAGRWAAKEAILKCLGTGWQRGICWTDLEAAQRRQWPAARFEWAGRPATGAATGVSAIFC